MRKHKQSVRPQSKLNRANRANMARLRREAKKPKMHLRGYSCGWNGYATTVESMLWADVTCKLCLKQIDRERRERDERRRVLEEMIPNRGIANG